MASAGSRAAVRCPGWLMTVAVTVAIGLVLEREHPAPRTGGRDVDDAARNGRRAGDGPDHGHPRRSAPDRRKAYLLAFHQAQDAGDVEHMLAVADRLDRSARRTWRGTSGGPRIPFWKMGEQLPPRPAPR